MTVRSLRYLALNERTAVKKYIGLIRDRFPDRVISVTLFGSKARGDADAESDIDLLVLLDTRDSASRSELWRIASDISLEHNVVLSVRVFARKRWHDTRRTHPPLYRAIEADGIALTPELSGAPATWRSSE